MERNNQTPVGEEKKKRSGILVAIAPFAVLIAMMFCVIRSFGADALSGGSQVALLVSSAVGIAISILFFKVRWSRLEAAICDNFRSISAAIIILILIGAISGSWMISGIVPTLIVYGLKIIHPAIYLFAACIICAAVSLMTGSSWTTIATLGVALIAIGAVLGYSPALCAGAIISGAYFGDKVSPLSDTTVLASSMSGVPLFTHIKFMMRTTGPAFIIALTAYLVISLLHDTPAVHQAQELEDILRDSFNISPWLLTVPVITGLMIWKKVPALLTLLGSSVLAAVTALIAQPELVAQIAGCEGPLDAASAFKGIIILLSSSTSVETGSEPVNALVSTGGMAGMLQTIFLISCAATFGGIMVGGGMVDIITEALTSRISSRGSLVSATIATGIFSNLTTGDQYLSIILTSRIFKGMYEKLKQEDRLLSRSVEDSATITSVLIPWNSCGMTQSTVLRVSTFAYFPFCIFNLISPIISILTAYLSSRTGKSSPRRVGNNF